LAQFEITEQWQKIDEIDGCKKYMGRTVAQKTTNFD
jgi:hypothetical protein